VIRTARQVTELDADRIAVFGYAHVPWMKRHQALIPDHTLPDPLARFAQRRAIGEVLEREGGFVAIGLDHYARPGDQMAEAVATGNLRRSFQGYTTDGAPALIGVGASAIGCLPQGYVQNATGVPAYAEAIKSGRFATARGVALSPDDTLRRDLIERIMCDLAADIVAVAASHDADPAPLLDQARDLDRFVADGLVTWDGRRVVVTEAGRPFVRNVAALFDAYLNRVTDRPLHAQAV
jgi:oxygen-independent coproporphyrinogen-3 oxidase